MIFTNYEVMRPRARSTALRAVLVGLHLAEPG